MSLISRPHYLDFLGRHRDRPIIKVVSGIRRCGKSTLFKLFQDELLSDGVTAEQIIDINFELIEYDNLRDYRALYEYINERIISDTRMYIFLDEIQHVSQFERVVDNFFVQDNIDIYITGSNAYFMSSDMATLLTGRYVQIEMMPLSYKEYVDAYSESGLSRIALYKKYVSEGSFPGLLHMSDDWQGRQDYLQGLFNTVILKDVVDRLKIADIKLLESIVRYILANIGSLINPTKIANSLTSAGRKVDNKTVERYLRGLEDSLLLYEVERFDVRGKELLRLRPKYYVVDTAFKQFLLPEVDRDTGHILENIVYLELRRRGYNVYVGQLAKGEVDFVAQKPGGILEYYQVSETVLDLNTRERELAPLEAIRDQYPKYLLTMDEIYKTNNYNGIQQYNVLDWLLGESL